MTEPRPYYRVVTRDKSFLFIFWWNILAPDAPQPIAEYKFCEARNWRFDWAFVEQRVAVEVDGGVWMKFGGRHGSDEDREKGNAAAALGWRVLHYSPDMIERDPDAMVAQVLDAIEARL